MKILLYWIGGSLFVIWLFFVLRASYEYKEHDAEIKRAVEAEIRQQEALERARALREAE